MSQVRWEPTLMCVCGCGTRTGGMSFGLYMKVLICGSEIAALECVCACVARDYILGRGLSSTL